jgi:hypothetical protein
MVEVIHTSQTPRHKSGCLWAENKIRALDAMMHMAFNLEAVLLIRHSLNYRTPYLYSQPEPVEPPC